MFDDKSKAKSVDFIRNALEQSERRNQKLQSEIQTGEKQNASILQSLVNQQESTRSLQGQIESQEQHIRMLVGDAVKQEEKFEKFHQEHSRELMQREEQSKRELMIAERNYNRQLDDKLAMFEVYRKKIYEALYKLSGECRKLKDRQRDL